MDGAKANHQKETTSEWYGHTAHVDNMLSVCVYMGSSSFFSAAVLSGLSLRTHSNAIQSESGLIFLPSLYLCVRASAAVPGEFNINKFNEQLAAASTSTERWSTVDGCDSGSRMDVMAGKWFVYNSFTIAWREHFEYHQRMMIHSYKCKYFHFDQEIRKAGNISIKRTFSTIANI